jgi:hypothetical protein
MSNRRSCQERAAGLWLASVLLLTGACGDQAGDSTQSTGTSTGNDTESTEDTENVTTSSGCAPGTMDCVCAEDSCLGGLACVGGMCVEQVKATGGDGSGTPCGTSEECAPTEACHKGECVDTDNLYFEVRVVNYSSDDCTDASHTVVFELYEDGILKYAPPERPCPGEWVDDLIVYDSLKPLMFQFTIYEGGMLDGTTYHSWGDFGPVPKDILHAGIVSNNDFTGTYEFTFTPTFL